MEDIISSPDTVIYKNMTRDEVINRFVELDRDSWTAEDTTAVMRYGCRGYDNWSDKELLIAVGELFDDYCDDCALCESCPYDGIDNRVTFREALARKCWRKELPGQNNEDITEAPHGG